MIERGDTDLEKPTRLYLVRHAETEWNTAMIFQGHLDSTLTPRGLQQAARLAERLASEGIVAVYSSDQGRCVRTAQIVASRVELAAVPQPELREIDCGEWTGKSYQDVRVLWPEHFSDWKDRPHLHRMPGGESVAEVQSRGLRFLEKVARLHPGQKVCAVTHHTVVRTVLCHLEGRPLAEMWKTSRQPNCSINLIELRDGGFDLVEVANTLHLADVGTAATTSIA